jgi:5-formaminoimidazole-4-carboxamide-1-beta-D-ribofuranosyl 5'-monophosphate synthetase
MPTTSSHSSSKVVKSAIDEDIQSAVFTLVALRTTPTTIFNKAVLDTLLKSPSSQQDSEQIHDKIDRRT